MDVHPREAPSYLGEFQPAFKSATRSTPLDDGRTKKLLIFDPKFGVDQIAFDFQDPEIDEEIDWTRTSHGLHPPFVMISRVRYGWPLYSTHVDRVGTSMTKDRTLLAEYWDVTNELAGLRRGIEAPKWWPKVSGVYEIPIVPIVPGFLVNTLIFGSACLLPGITVRFVRQQRRSRRGACLTCGYALTGTDRCPECGTEA